MTTKADTKHALLDAAEAAVRMHGHDGFSYADLSAEIGIQKASIHYHFPSKADLLTAVMKRYREQMDGRLERIDETCDRASERLNAYLEIYRDALKGCTALCLCVAFSAGQEALTGETRAEIDIFRRNVSRWLIGTFRLARQDKSVTDVTGLKEEAAAFFSLAEGAQLSARFSGDIAEFDRAVSNLKRRFR